MQNFLFTIALTLFGALLGFFISFISNRKFFNETARDAVQTHVAILHQDSMYEYVGTKIKDQHRLCDERFKKGAKKFEDLEVTMKALRDGVSYLVREQGGNPKDFDL